MWRCPSCLLALLASPALSLVDRRGFVRSLSSATVLAPFGARATETQQQQMRTSADVGSYAELTGQARGANLGAGSISGKSRPVTGCVMVEAPRTDGDSIVAELILSNNVLAKVVFVPGQLKLAKGFYYDVEARNKAGDSAYVSVVARPEQRLDALPSAFFVDSVLSPSGRFGAFGAPTDVRVVADAGTATRRQVELAFAPNTPGGTSAPRRAIIEATTAPGSPDILMLVSTSSQQRWPSGGKALAMATSASFNVISTRPTKLANLPSSDFRFEEQGGIRAPPKDD